MKTLTLVIPVYNEQARVSECLFALQSWTVPPFLKLETIIFVNDGSIDHTKAKIARHKNFIEKKLKTKLNIISYRTNKGKGYAIKVGMNASTSDYTLFLDADMSTPLSELNKFLPAIKNNVDVIVGTRKNGHSTVLVHQAKHREIMGKIFTYLTNVMLNTWVTDFTCGFKAFSRESKDKIFPKVTCNRWSFDAEAIFLARRYEFTIGEIAVTWTDKKGTKVHLIQDAIRSFYDIVSIRFIHALKLNSSIGAKYWLTNWEAS